MKEMIIKIKQIKNVADSIMLSFLLYEFAGYELIMLSIMN